MVLYGFLFAGALLLALAAAFVLPILRRQSEKKVIPNVCIGAIRVTREGRNMLIVRKEDGSFEMLDEEPVRRQCLAEGQPPE